MRALIILISIFVGTCSHYHHGPTSRRREYTRKPHLRKPFHQFWADGYADVEMRRPFTFHEILDRIGNPEMFDYEPKSYKPRDPTPSCFLDNGMTDSVRKKFLDKHNEYRSIVAKGQAINPKAGHSSPAARMMRMSYDCGIEKNMMEWAKRCRFEHSPKEYRPGLGQNLFAISSLSMNKTNAAEMAVESWFSELEQFGIPQDNVLTQEVFDSGVGHYTQLVWQSTTKIGCAVMWCDQMTLVGCEYSPAGNYIDSLIYDVGEPCSMDGDCRCEGCICDAAESLCIPP